ncbi:hypothetical protein AC578_6414 [Pseudocercospora eumusae]|uniref:Uncharacterized protein n=1 Tax=Pseudocercospora eumusae TaxID=321146 RepID=A0A139H6W2_9PEZI|nr:hypothetical protein AC578_6414 [Pseudocercospora eumusae]
MYRPQPPPMDAEEVEAIFASIDEKIKQSTPNNITVTKSDIPEDDAVLSSLHQHLSTMIEARDEKLEDLISSINAIRSKLDSNQKHEKTITNQSILMTFKEVDDLPRETRRAYLSFIPVKVIVELNAEIEAKEGVLRMVEKDLATQNWVETQQDQEYSQ